MGIKGPIVPFGREPRNRPPICISLDEFERRMVQATCQFCSKQRKPRVCPLHQETKRYTENCPWGLEVMV